MLGCKLKRIPVRCNHVSELIDTCWDVNNHETVPCWQGTGELIDTCWDVNLRGSRSVRTHGFELIDTCWDVNINFSTPF